MTRATPGRDNHLHYQKVLASIYIGHHVTLLLHEQLSNLNLGASKIRGPNIDPQAVELLL